MRADSLRTAPDAHTANRLAGVPAAAARQRAGGPGDKLAAAPQPVADAPAAQPAAAPAKDANIVPDAAKVTAKLRQQAAEKQATQDRLGQVPSMSAARPGDPLDESLAAVSEAKAGGKLDTAPDAVNALAYVTPYMEPNDYAHRNYCGAGAATVLLSHWDPDYPRTVDIDKLGDAMDLDPNSGVWVKDIVKPVNEMINQKAGQDINWYRYGAADSLDDFRFMINYDVVQNGVPLITSLDTAGLPGWGATDVGHIVAVYGYHKDASGTEWVVYTDTAPESSGYAGKTFTVVELGQFWRAVSGNSAQVW